LEHLHRQDLVAEMEAAPIVAELVRLLDAGEQPDLTAITEKLSPALQRAVAEVAFDPDARPVSYGEISAYLNVLERKRLARQRQQLLAVIRDGQRQSSPDSLRGLLEAVQQLDRKLAELG
jgi:hypothetical protein